MELSKQLTDWPSEMHDYMLTGTGKVHPRKCLEGSEVGNRKYLYSFFNPGARWGGSQHHTPTVLPPGVPR